MVCRYKNFGAKIRPIVLKLTFYHHRNISGKKQAATVVGLNPKDTRSRISIWLSARCCALQRLQARMYDLKPYAIPLPTLARNAALGHRLWIDRWSRFQ